VKENGAAVRGTAEPGEEAATENQTKGLDVFQYWLKGELPDGIPS
jgi:hypothetical protein